MNGFLRKITSLAAVGNLVVVVAIFAAVAAAASNPGKYSGDGNSGRRATLNKDKSKTESDDRTGDRGNSEEPAPRRDRHAAEPGQAQAGRVGASVPVGSVLDTRQGEVTLNTVPREDGVKQWASFSGAIFQVRAAR
jgi:hypothetical protein